MNKMSLWDTIGILADCSGGKKCESSVWEAGNSFPFLSYISLGWNWI